MHYNKNPLFVPLPSKFTKMDKRQSGLKGFRLMAISKLDGFSGGSEKRPMDS
jgi:hypothetical protein